MTAVPAAAVPNKWLVLVVACAGMFSFSIDVSSFGLAIPTLATAFRAPPDTILWLGLGFTLVSTGIILTMGRLGDTLGRKQVYLSGLVLFTLGVAACALANGFAALLVARMVQAVGGAMILSNAIAAATEAFPREERGKAVGFTSAAVSLGLMAGGPFGGVVLDTLDWRALFWTRLPLLAAVIAVTAVSFPRTKRRGDGLHIDVPGSALVFVFLSATVVALNRGPVWGWASPALALTVLAVALSLAALVWVESRVAHPVLALGMFRNRIFSGAITSQVINFAAMSAYYFLTPFLLTRALGLSNGRAGLLLLVMPAWMMVGSPITGGLSDRFGSRPLAVVGMLFIAAGLYTGAGLGPGSGTIDIVWRLSLVGIGSALFQGPNNAAIMGAAPPERLGAASALIATSRNMGQAIGTALFVSIFVSAAVAHAAGLGAPTDDRNNLPPASVAAGVGAAYLAAAAVAALGALSSLIRGAPAAPPELNVHGSAVQVSGGAPPSRAADG